MYNIVTVTCTYKNYEIIFIVQPFFFFFNLFHFFRNSFYFLRPFYIRSIQISCSMFGSDCTIRRTLLHLTSTNGWCTIRETRSTKAKYGPAIAGVGWIVLVSVFLFSSVNIFIRQWLQTLYVTILFFISPSLAYTLFLSLPTFFSFFSHLISAPVQELRLSLISSRRDDLV